LVGTKRIAKLQPQAPNEFPPGELSGNNGEKRKLKKGSKGFAMFARGTTPKTNFQGREAGMRDVSRSKGGKESQRNWKLKVKKSGEGTVQLAGGKKQCEKTEEFLS